MTNKTLTQLAIPMVISFTFRFLFTLVDTVYAAAIAETEPTAVAAIGLFIPVQTISIALWVGLSAGFTASLSQAFGKRDEARVQALKRAMRRIHVALVPILLSIAAVLWFGVPHVDGLEPALKDSFRTYATILIVGMPFSGFLSIYPDSIVKAHHDTVSTMKAGLWSTFANVTLNTLFVFVFHWGLWSIALATVLSRYASLTYAALRVRHLERQRLADPDWDRGATGWPGPLQSILTLALPSSFAYLLVLAEESTVIYLLKELPNSTTAIASYGVYSRLLSLASMPAIATAIAVLPFVARRVPEGRALEAWHELKRNLPYALGLAFLIAAPIGWIWAEDTTMFLVPKAVEQAGEAAWRFLFLLPLAALAVAPLLMLRPVFEAAQKPRLGILITVAKSLVFSIPLILLGRYLAPMAGMDPILGILIGMAAATLLASALTFFATRQLLVGSARR